MTGTAIRALAAITAFSALFVGWSAHAAEIPEPGVRDPRVRFVTYKRDEVTVVHVRRGAVTRVILDDGEKIQAAGSGFSSDCSKDENEWCVIAKIGDSQVWIKPKDGATHNNLEIRTDRRDYSLDLQVLDDRSKNKGELAAEPFFRVVYRYPLDLPPQSALVAAFAAQAGAAGQSVAATSGAGAAAQLAAAKPAPRNWSYSLQVMDGGGDIAPDLVFDDGRFTYFRFPPSREIPAIFYLTPRGEEGRVNWHVEGDMVVVQRLAKRFVLRLGSAVVGVWNDGEVDGIGAPNGTTVDGVVRTVREGGAK